VKAFIPVIFLSAAALAQNSTEPKIVTFNRADTEHCRVIAVNGKALLQTTYNGISVAVGMPENRGNGEFSVYVSVAQEAAATSAIEVAPKHFSAVYSDAAHTRFTYFDKAHDLDTQASIRAAGMSPGGGSPPSGPGGPGPGGPGGPPGSAPNSDSSFADPQMTHPEVMAASAPRDINPGTRSAEEARQVQLHSQQGTGSASMQADMARPQFFLHQTSVKPGSHASGTVYFRKPKGFKAEIQPGSTLGEIDIPINGVTFRF
jgi:hypothetical protein